MKYKIAIVGATGVVGRTALKVIEEKGLLDNTYILYASANSAGKRIKLGNRFLKVRFLEDGEARRKFDFVIFCTRDEVSKNYVKRFAKNGARVIDFSAAYRKKYPLIVPEVNSEKIKGNIICNPNCSTIAGVMALYGIYKKFGIKRIIYSTYQAVSGAGKAGLDDLNKNKTPQCFVYPIKDNLISYIGPLQQNLFSKEENKMIYETKKILGDRNIAVSATCVRVPISVCHSESITFETTKRCGLKKIVQTLKNTDGVEYIDDYPHFPMPIEVRGQDKVFVGRVRKDINYPNTYHIFVVSDNLRKGAAQNGVQILEQLIKQKENKV